MELEALKGRIIIKQLDTPSMRGNFFVPKTARTKLPIALVISVEKNPNHNVLPGQIVLFRTDFGRDFEHEGDLLRDVPIDSVVGVIDEQEVEGE